jgi:uncharacterized protein YjaG (DUF416 family)
MIILLASDQNKKNKTNCLFLFSTGPACGFTTRLIRNQPVEIRVHGNEDFAAYAYVGIHVGHVASAPVPGFFMYPTRVEFVPSALIRDFVALVSRYTTRAEPEVNLDQWLTEFLELNPVVDGQDIENADPHVFADL